MPAFIHQRAEHILAKSPKMAKAKAFAIATQQAHKLGKTPKNYGTKEGKREAKAKYDKPRKEYVKTPNPKEKKAADMTELEKEAFLQSVDVKVAELADRDWYRQSTGAGTSPQAQAWAARSGGGAPSSSFSFSDAAAKARDHLVTPAGAVGGFGGAVAAGQGSRVGGAVTGAMGGAAAQEVIKRLMVAGKLPADAAGALQAIGPGIAGSLTGGAYGKAKRALLGDETKLGSSLVGAVKLAIAGDDPYMLDQVGKPKVRPVKAEAPNPKYRVKQAMIPSSGQGPGSGLAGGANSAAAKKLKQSQSIGVPKMPAAPKMQTMGVKMAGMSDTLKALSPSMKKVLTGAGIGAAGGAVAGAAAGGEGNRLKGALMGGAGGAALGGAAGWAGPRYQAGRGAGLSPRQSAGALVEDIGAQAKMPRVLEMGKKVSGPAKTRDTAVRLMPAITHSQVMAKAAYATSQYSGTLGPGRGLRYGSNEPIRNPMLRHGGSSNEELMMAQKMMKERDKGWTPITKVGSMCDELAKLNSMSPQAMLGASQRVGAPRKSAPMGRSKQQQSKPVGYGLPAAGATKPAVI